MVYTVTFNPAIDYVVHTGEMKLGSTNRSDREEMYFGGKGDEPMAYIELSLFGGASDAVYDKLTAAICDAVSAETGIAPANIYVKYEEAEHWGWNGSNF